MSDPFLGEIKIVSFNFAPQGWAQCNGGFLPINQNQALFSILGTRYGGNGQTTFALPDLRGRVPMHFGSHIQGEVGGEQAHTVSIAEMPAHTHMAMGTHTPGSTPIPQGQVFANTTINGYVAPSMLVPLSPDTVTNVGGSQPHNNMSPYLTLTFCIALQGIFPTRN